ncbi:hypothetical protein [Frigoriflavimonas asaccharolytica]|uniref:Uncharacterized protein n=1 Tax=Frigoriflavimonas asaccharolytica TaxID=2735899 RepID=A0A8J8KBH2_9FLAO|nr:hypothetical protein [Frigoriflavimonas asaccharolytica]NRS92569.1 hypothetical protein [Frigoriflavimonas asaccharolytica]
MKLPEKFSFISFYNQFYISDGNAKSDANSYNFSEDVIKNRLFCNLDEMIIFTQTYGNVSGNVQFYENEPKITNILNYDHIVEGNIKISSGQI